MRRRSRRRPPSKSQLIREKYPINGKIRAKSIRLVATEEGSIVITRSEALQRAREAELDLIQISLNGDIAICKLMDFNKFKYQLQSNKEDIFRKKNTVKSKEIRIGPNIDAHDFEFKANQARKFLAQGHPLLVTMRFRGRQIRFKDLGEKKLLEFCVALENEAKAENLPKLEGRQMRVVLRPKK